MHNPDIETRLRNTDDGVLYRIMAYRKLTEVEAAGVVRHYLLNTKPRKQPKPDEVVTIHTVAGMLPGL
jgi:hypothetical protein